MTQTWRRCGKEDCKDCKPKIRKEVWLRSRFFGVTCVVPCFSMMPQQALSLPKRKSKQGVAAISGSASSPSAQPKAYALFLSVLQSTASLPRRYFTTNVSLRLPTGSAAFPSRQYLADESTLRIRRPYKQRVKCLSVIE